MSPVTLVTPAFSFADQLSHGFLANLGKSFLLNLVYSLRRLFERSFLQAECLHDISRWFNCHRCHLLPANPSREPLGPGCRESCIKRVQLPPRAPAVASVLLPFFFSPSSAPPPSQASFPRTTTVLSPAHSVRSYTSLLSSFGGGGGGGGAAQIFQFLPHSAGECHPWQPTTPFSEFLGTQLVPTKF